MIPHEVYGRKGENCMRKRKFMKIVATVMLGASLVLSGCGSGSKSDDTGNSSENSKKVLRVGMECANPPYNWSQTDDSNGAVPIEGSNEYVNGYDITMAKELAESMGCELEVYKIEWNGLIMALQSDKIDAIIAGMSPTEERKQSVDFTDAYYNADYVTLVKTDSSFADAASVDDLKGAKVTSQQGTKMYDTLSQIPDADVQDALPDMSSVVVALTSGRIDATIAEKPMAMAAVSTNPDLKMIEFAADKGYDVDESITSISIAVRKGDSDRLDAFNTKLADISSDTRDQWMNDAIKNQPASE